MKRALILLGALLLGAYIVVGVPPVVSCPCDHARPESLEARVCGLCRTAERQDSEFYFVKDINPHKPNRYLALPRDHGHDLQGPASLPDEQRARYWRADIEKAEELYPGKWGLAANGHFFRTQCHAHIHMGLLSRLVEHEDGELFDDPAGFPNVGLEDGVWVHPLRGRYCIHLDRDLAEVILVR